MECIMIDNLLPIDGQTSLDIESIKASLKDYLTSSGVIKDVDYESSNIAILVNILAYSIYNVNANGALRTKETMLVSSNVRENIINIAKQMSYNITRSVSSKLNVTFGYTLSGSDSITIPKNTRFNVGDFVFVTQEDLLLTSTISTVTADLIEGVFIDSNDDSRLRKVLTNNTSKITVPYKNIENNSINVVVNRDETDMYYTKANSFLDLDGTNYVEVYDVDTGYVNLVFAYSNLGAELLVEDIVSIELIVTNGSIANNINTCTQKDDIYDSNSVLVEPTITINSISRSGQDEESDESIKLNAPLAYNTGNRVVNDYDYESFLVQSSLVEKATAWGFEGMPATYMVDGMSHISAIPQDVNAKFFTDLEIVDLISLIASKRIISTYRKFFQPQYIYLDVDIKIIGSVHNLATKQALVEAKYDEIYSNYLSDFDSYLYYSKIVRELEGVFLEDNATVKITLKPYFMLEAENFDYGISTSDSRVLMFIPDSEKKRYLEKGGVTIEYPTNIYEANDLITNGWTVVVDNQEQYNIDFLLNDTTILSGTNIVINTNTVGTWNKDGGYIDFNTAFQSDIQDAQIYIEYNDLMNVKYVNNTYFKKGVITYV